VRRKQFSGSSVDPPLARGPFVVRALLLSTVELTERQLVRHILNDLLLQPPQYLPAHALTPGSAPTQCTRHFSFELSWRVTSQKPDVAPNGASNIGGIFRGLLPISPQERRGSMFVTYTRGGAGVCVDDQDKALPSFRHYEPEDFSTRSRMIVRYLSRSPAKNIPGPLTYSSS
jgi:hypothetical protein